MNVDVAVEVIVLSKTERSKAPCFPSVFSPQFGEIEFWWAQGKNT